MGKYNVRAFYPFQNNHPSWVIVNFKNILIRREMAPYPQLVFSP
jgi:hypothetical protein